MNDVMFKRLLWIALGVVLLTVAVIARRAPEDNLANNETKLLPGLKEQISELSEIRFIQAGNTPLITLKKSDKGWTVPEQSGYAADVGKVREYLDKLADASLMEAKTKKAEKFATLGVVDIKQADASGVMVELIGPKKTHRVLIGNYNGQGTGTFVRLGDEPQAWLAKGNLIVDKTPSAWLATLLFDIDSASVRGVKIDKQGQLISILKQAPADANFVVENLPAGKSLSSEFAANPIATALTAFRAEAVTPVTGIAPPEAGSNVKASYFLFNGVMIDITGWKSEGQNWVSVNASLDPARTRIHALADIAREQLDAKAEAKDKAKVSDQDAGEKVKTPSNAEMETKVKAAIDKAQAEVDAINRLGHGWAFQIPEYKFALFNKTMAELTANTP